MSAVKAHRLWKISGLQVPRKRSRRRPSASRPRPQAPTMANQVWAYDFVFDACANGQQLKCLTVIDEFTRESLAIDVSGSIRSGRVIEVLSRLISEGGEPAVLRSDNGPEFIAKELQRWLAEQNIKTLYITPASPWENGFVESFHSRFRDECLNREQLWTLTEARVVIEDFRQDYNAERPHSSLGYLSPQRFAAEQPLTIPSSRPDRQAGPSFRLGLPTTTAVSTSTQAKD